MIDWDLPEAFQTPGGLVRWGRRGSGPPVVLLHGTPFSSVVWRTVARALADSYEIFVWDMLGYGSSAKDDDHDVSLAAQSEIFVALLRHWGLDRPSVVGHDFGGAVALRAHLLHGARYRALALVDPVAIGPWGSDFFRLVRDHASVFEQLPAHLHLAVVREYVRTASSYGLPPHVLERLVQPWTGSGQRAFYRQIAQADQRYTDEIEARYSEIELPVIVCWGAEDEWIPLSQGRRLASRLGDAPLEIVEGAGHLVQEDAPERLTAILRAFLARPSNAGSPS